MSKAPKTALQLAPSARQPRNRVFEHGETIPSTGLYSVTHSNHRLPREVTLRKGEAFPHCAACENPVTFVLIKAAPAEGDDKTFKVVLYVLPVTEEGEAGAVAV